VEVAAKPPDSTADIGDIAIAAAKEAAARLNDPNPRICQNAIDALGQMADNAIPHAKLMGSRLSDPDLGVRKAVIRAFAKLGPAAIGGAPDVATHFSHTEEVVRRSSMQALLALAPYDGETASAGAAAAAAELENSNPVARFTAAECLMGFGPIAAPHGDRLAKCLEDEDTRVRISTVRALVAIGPKAVSSLSQIKKRLDHSSRDTRRAAVDAMRGLSPVCAKFADSVGKLLHEEPSEQSEEVLRQRVQILEILGGADSNALPYLHEIAKELESGDWGIRRAAIQAFEDLGAVGGKSADEVAKRLLHQDAQVRRAAAETLGRMRNHAGGYSHRVEGMLDTEEDPDVRSACERAVKMLLEVGALAVEEPCTPLSAKKAGRRQPR